MASSTYVLGLVILGSCSLLGLFPGRALAAVGALFLVINLGLLGAFLLRWNTRFADPSLTSVQVHLAVTMVAVILVLGREVQFVAAPFYSVLFVFGMLGLRPRQLAAVAAYVLVTYCAAIAIRHELYGAALDLRVETVSAALVVGSSAWFATVAVYISNLRARLNASMQHIASLATHDALTGLWNRRQIDLDLDAAIHHAERHGSVLCVVLVDIDQFKAINDRHGHAVGDDVLVSVAACIAATVRLDDRAGRFGGEEFLLLLPATSVAQASALAERLRMQLAALQSLPAGEPPVTASFGLAAWRRGETSAEVLRRADQALYRAKAAGRNRVEADSLFCAMG
jgi:diguanylate cyclase (GGDEF)-like protein